MMVRLVTCLLVLALYAFEAAVYLAAAMMICGLHAAWFIILGIFIAIFSIRALLIRSMRAWVEKGSVSS